VADTVLTFPYAYWSRAPVPPDLGIRNADVRLISLVYLTLFALCHTAFDLSFPAHWSFFYSTRFALRFPGFLLVVRGHIEVVVQRTTKISSRPLFTVCFPLDGMWYSTVNPGDYGPALSRVHRLFEHVGMAKVEFKAVWGAGFF